MPIGRARKTKLASATISDEEGNTSECSHRQTSSSVYSTLESPNQNFSFHPPQNVVSNQPVSDRYHPHQNQNQN